MVRSDLSQLDQKMTSGKSQTIEERNMFIFFFMLSFFHFTLAYVADVPIAPTIPFPDKQFLHQYNY